MASRSKLVPCYLANREGDVGFTWSREFIYVEELNAGESSNSGFYALLQVRITWHCGIEVVMYTGQVWTCIAITKVGETGEIPFASV